MREEIEKGKCEEKKMNEDEKIKEIEKKETDIAVRVPIWEGKYVRLSIVADSKKE